MAREWPTDWKRNQLGSVADVNWGDTSVTKASYVDSGFPAYSASGPDGFLPYADFDRVGVVLSAIGADCGKTWLAKGKWSCIKNTLRFWATDTEVDTAFLFWLTRDPAIWPKRGSAQPFISQGDARALEIAYPPLPQQRAIAHILGTLDDKIELNRRMSETLEAMARALFKSWFVDFDPVRAKAEGRDPGLPKPLADLFPARLVDSELGEIPEGWEVGTLGDVAESPRRSLRPHEISADTAYIALEHMPRRCIALSDWASGDGIESNKFEFKRGEILFGKLRPYFHKVGVAPVDGVCSTDIVVVSSRQPAWFGFVLGHVSSVEFVEYTNAGSTGTKMPRTSWADMARYEVVLPPEQVAAAFTSLIRPQVERIVAGIHESRTLASLRDTLLPKLISGELRLPNVEHFLASVPPTITEVPA
jgi:type I restriction enzyme S subunit